MATFQGSRLGGFTVAPASPLLVTPLQTNLYLGSPKIQRDQWIYMDTTVTPWLYTPTGWSPVNGIQTESREYQNNCLIPSFCFGPELSTINTKLCNTIPLLWTPSNRAALEPIKVSWLQWPHFRGEPVFNLYLKPIEVAWIQGWPHFRSPDNITGDYNYKKQAFIQALQKLISKGLCKQGI